jgi:hypothetical protein
MANRVSGRRDSGIVGAVVLVLVVLLVLDE